MPHVSLLTRQETEATGQRVTPVAASYDGVDLRCSADQVLVACGAMSSVPLLRRSANPAHPRGLANGSDVVDRHSMRRNTCATIHAPQ